MVPCFRRGPSHFALSLLALGLFTSWHVADAAKGETIQLSFLNDQGAVIGTPQTIPWGECTNLDLTQLNDSEGVYASVSTSMEQAALNLYSSPYCQILSASAVGRWANTGRAQGMVGVRWEGTAPSSLTPGTVRPDKFPEQMVVQTQGPDPDADPIVWNVDPGKAKILVGLVAGVLVVGVAIGVYQVYRASQYVPPPKKPKKPKTGLNIKKIKKKDAYYKKPERPLTGVENDPQSFQRLQNSESPEPLLNRPLMFERGGRDSQYSEAATFVEWGQQQQQHQQPQQQQQQQRGHHFHSGDSVSIDMRETHTGGNARLSPFRDQQGSNVAELISLDSPHSSNSSHQRGRGGEVLVPMHAMDNNNNNNNYYNNSPVNHHTGYGRAAVRRSSSSRSR